LRLPAFARTRANISAQGVCITLLQRDSVIRRDDHMRSVSVLVPTYQDMHLLLKSLPVFLGSESDGIEVIILNNDPSQDVVSYLATEAGITIGDRVRVVDMGSDAGFARAINCGISSSRGDMLFICNADLFPSATYVQTMCVFFDQHPRAGLATGKILRYDLAADLPTDIIDSAGLVLSRNRRFLARGEGSKDIRQFDDEEQVFGVDGAAVFARRTALESISLDGEYFDESFFMYKEDWDLSWRVRLLGWECWFVPSAVAFHARTSRGLGERAYLTAPRAFHGNEKAKPPLVRFHSLKNQWLMLVKNEDLPNFLRDFPFVLSRELIVLGYNLAFSPKTLRAIGDFVRLLPPTLAKRRAIKRRQTVPSSELRRWIDRPSAPPPTPARVTTAHKT
jgi:GT2 family glycosyltransferase